jgi:diguanylate cyclase (GGDEF)-like protein
MKQMVKSGRSEPAHGYVLIAMANATRAAAIRSVALELTEDVAVAPDGAAATQLISKRGAPRLLIADLSLPALDGFALVRHIRQHTRKNRSAVIVMSAHESLRVAAQDLADSLEIASVLRLDADRAALRSAMVPLLQESHEREAVVRQADVRSRLPAELTTLEELLHEAVVAAARHFQAPIAAAYAKIGDEERFTAFVSVSNPEQFFGGPSVWAMLPQVAESGEPLIVPDVEGHPVFGAFGVTMPAMRGFASVPMMSPQGTSWGALCIVDTKPLALDGGALDAFAAHGQDLGRTLDERIGAHRDPVATFKALEQLAATDPLTSLANRRGCEKSIAGEISRAKREKRPISCILLDVDRFKQVNDTLGHAAGDQLLRELSAILRGSVRAYDIVCRWGGEEFLIVLPGADLKAARSLAERIRVAVETHPTQSGGMTISAGTAVFDEQYDFEATLRLADRRLYEAKAAGRNCIV